MWIIFVITACLAIGLVMSLAMCLCWKKRASKDDLLGLDGMVIQKNPDENVNHLPSAAECLVDNLNNGSKGAEFIEQSKKREIPTNNTRRSLPDIPAEHETRTWDIAGDNSSGHYATVGLVQIKREILQNTAGPSNILNNVSPYESVKYDKIQSKEHPYAQVQQTNFNRVPEECTPNGTSLTPEPCSSTRSRRSSAHSGADIPAASAVAGGIAASLDLPYMTPPLTQPNFSGDSQDSSKGYTSISVREPLAAIKSQTKEGNNKDFDQHYSTVSDDSDDVYTTIADPNQIYTSESETYAKIPAHSIVVEAEVNINSSRRKIYESIATGSNANNSNELTTGHSRQGSSSSSVGIIGSPKPEKRQIDSPLPPPPPATRHLDDLYAKVNKNKKKDDSDGDNTSGKFNNLSLNEEKTCDTEHNYETLTKLTKKVQSEEPGYASINGSESISSDPGYEVLKHRPLSASDFNYELLNSIQSDNQSKVDAELKSGSESDPNYESVNHADLNYETLTDLDDPPYEKLGHSRIHLDVPVVTRGYENIDSSESSNGTTEASLNQPLYQHLTNENSDSLGYETINCVLKASSDNTSSSLSSEKSELNCGNKDEAVRNTDLLEDDVIFQV